MFDGSTLFLLATAVAASTVLFIMRLIKRNGAEEAGKRYPPATSALSLLVAIVREGVGVMPDYFQRCAEKLGPVLSCKLGGRLESFNLIKTVCTKLI